MPRPDRTPTTDRKAKAAQAARQARTGRRSGATIWVALGTVLVLIAGLVTWAIVSEIRNRPDLSAVQTFEDLSQDHVPTRVDYAQAPPAGGEHNAAWWNCGIYDEPLPDHHVVHSLEHGAVWLTYQPGLAEEQLEVLRDLASQEFMLLSPYEGQEHPVMATAWGHQLGVDTADDDRIEAFVREYRQGPQTPEPGAACTGGTSVDLVAGR